jgi:hypothetical protein
MSEYNHNKELEELKKRAHKGITVFKHDQIDVPCIILSTKRFDEIIRKVAGKPFSVDTDLNILQDGLGHVFVEIVLTFSKEDIYEKILIYANDSIEFFEFLATCSMIALSSSDSDLYFEPSSENVLMIQLPKPERAKVALEMIKQGLIPR